MLSIFDSDKQKIAIALEISAVFYRWGRFQKLTSPPSRKDRGINKSTY
jgi:hypothetical protein